ncbi:MAG: hypothetical protein WCJ35_02585 [Planctomycetota bacterium]
MACIPESPSHIYIKHPVAVPLVSLKSFRGDAGTCISQFDRTPFYTILKEKFNV